MACTTAGFCDLATAWAATWLPLTKTMSTSRSMTIAMMRCFVLGKCVPGGGVIVGVFACASRSARAWRVDSWRACRELLA